MKAVNLSRRPFVNQRPVIRASILLGVLGLAFAAWNIYLYLSYWNGSAETRARLVEIDQAIRNEQGSVDELVRGFESLDLEVQNLKIAFLNQLISARTFPWSGLFDRLGEVLPLDVKLLSVQPSVRLNNVASQLRRVRRTRATDRRRDRQREPIVPADRKGRDEVDLVLFGQAKNDEALLALVDALYADPAFRNPFLERENIEGTGLLQFNLQVIYLTQVDQLEPAMEASTAEGSDADPEDLDISGEPRRAGSGDDPDRDEAAAARAGVANLEERAFDDEDNEVQGVRLFEDDEDDVPGRVASDRAAAAATATEEQPATPEDRSSGRRVGATAGFVAVPDSSGGQSSGGGGDTGGDSSGNTGTTPTAVQPSASAAARVRSPGGRV